ncbi:MAG: DUF1003 domain-containing protein [Candidatus Daviesbacteria bacterium]|nr:DUF1003 domain-containing protein [Candidatus Daviesbacteria bacterium]
MDNPEKITTIKELRKTSAPIKNPNAVHRSRMSKLDEAALFVTNKVGSMGFFFVCVILVTIPLIFTQAISIVQYISSGILQLILLPLIIIGQNLQGRHAEIRAQHDFDTNVKAEKEIETILLHLEKQDKIMLEILQRIEKIERSKTSLTRRK